MIYGLFPTDRHRVHCPVQPDHIVLRIGQGLQGMVRAAGEYDTRRLGVRLFETMRQIAQIGKRKRCEFPGTEKTCPRIEHLHGLRPCLNLPDQIVREHLGKATQKFMRRQRIPV